MGDDYSWIADLAKYGVGALGTAGANQAMQGAYAEVLRNLKDRFTDYRDIPPAAYQNIVAQQLGPSALGDITPDARSRLDQQAAIAQLDQISGAGGLTLADKAALDQIEATLNRNTTARRKGIQNQYAARGQFGSGAQLASELSAAQDAAETANARGEGIAGQAQQRAMQAVLQKAGLSRQMSNDDYAMKARAAQAHDAIRMHNASMTTDAAKYNNSLRGQSFNDQLNRFGGMNQVTGQTNNALLGSGQQEAKHIGAQTYGATNAIDRFAQQASQGGSGSTASHGAEHSMSGGGNHVDDDEEEGWP